jgi:peptidoglycan/xylan/chitin deacetylase (PgdA/CDA1 family)
MRLSRPCFLAKWLFPEVLFRIKTDDRLLCLTFDDGPDPASTPRIIDLLEIYDIRAIFFCDGRSAENNPGLTDLIRSRGHITGNHGYSHMNGWETPSTIYCDDVSRAAPFTSPTLFRPPYGRLKYRQYATIKKSYRIMMWDVMPYDYDSSSGSEKAMGILRKKIRPGSIIVLHDKPGSTVHGFLEEFIRYARKENYIFRLPDL